MRLFLYLCIYVFTSIHVFAENTILSEFDNLSSSNFSSEPEGSNHYGQKPKQGPPGLKGPTGATGATGSGQTGATGATVQQA